MYKLLIADDEPLEREGLQLMIERLLPHQFVIFHAEHGRSAIQQVEQHKPDIVFMDIKMPGIHGLEAIAEIRKTHAMMKIVIVTAYDYFAYAKESISLGVSEYLLKPVKKEQIVSVLKKLTAEIDAERKAREAELDTKEKLAKLYALSESTFTLFLMGHIADFDEKQMIPMEIESGFALAVQLESMPERPEALEAMKHHVQGVGHCLCSPLIDRQFSIFFKSDDHWEGKTVSFAQKLMKQLEKILQIRIKIGIGTIQKGIIGLKQSYQEAAAALYYLPVFGRVQHIADVPLTASSEEWKPLAVDKQQSVIEQVEEFLQENYDRDLSLEEVAQSVHLTPHYFSKLFKKQTGQTFSDYVTGLRIEKAKQLLRDASLNIKEICYDVGYKDPNYFSRVFKKITNMTPKQYREHIDRRSS
ncbi:AraC family transcriptional regulator [Anoxybacillus rupiensis]|uniref:AraC family transcriptional regulator n=1 Tax=Anoxybacteroides rupiense TaxID=311460 RepID=A0ABD5IZ30_9BACL|nr:AraC family transcriptional regulator [Anoxybacillus rupiensis]